MGDVGSGSGGQESSIVGGVVLVSESGRCVGERMRVFRGNVSERWLGTVREAVEVERV